MTILYRTKEYVPYQVEHEGYYYIPAVGNNLFEIHENLMSKTEWTVGYPGEVRRVSIFENIGVVDSDWWKKL